MNILLICGTLNQTKAMLAIGVIYTPQAAGTAAMIVPESKRGSTIAYVNEDRPGVIAIPLGAFADPDFPPPRFSIYEARRHRWTAVLGDDVEHHD